MYDDTPWFLIPIFIFIFFFFFFFVHMMISSSHEDNTYIPPCDFNHRGHWEVSVHNANDRDEVEPVVNKYITLGWHNIHAEIHNEGVQDRILAEC